MSSGAPHESRRSFEPPRAELAVLSRRALAVGGVAAALSIVGLLLDGDQFFRSYLVGWLTWLSVALGCLAILLIDHLAGGRWGIIVRRAMEAAASTLPILGLLMLPLLAGLPSVYAWARPEVVAADPLLQHKSAYLDTGFFIARAVLYFVIWSGSAAILVRLSRRQDTDGDPLIAQRMRTLAAPFLGLLALAATFGSFDWLMSLDAHWFSSLYGVYFLGGVGVAGFAFLILIATWLAGREPLGPLFTRTYFHDYGKFLLAFVMLWTYFAVSQLLIIWSANLPEEITWYLDRRDGGWLWVSIAIALLHFALPFLILLSADVKKKAGRLAAIALLLVAMRWVDLYWQAAPSFHPEVTIHWLDLTTVAAVGGLWLAVYFRRLGKHPLLPVNAPRAAEVLVDD